MTFTVSSHSAFALFFWQLHRIAEFEPTRFKHRLRWKSHSIFVMILWSGWSWPRSGRVGFHGWIPGLDHVGWWESGVLTKGQIWPNLRWFEMILESCPLFQICAIFVDAEYVSSMFGVSGAKMGSLEMSSTVVKIQGLRSEWSVPYPKPVDWLIIFLYELKKKFYMFYYPL